MTLPGCRWSGISLKNERKTVVSTNAAQTVSAIRPSSIPNQRMVTDSAQIRFVTYFFTRLPWREGPFAASRTGPNPDRPDRLLPQRKHPLRVRVQKHLGDLGAEIERVEIVQAVLRRPERVVGAEQDL